MTICEFGCKVCMLHLTLNEEGEPLHDSATVAEHHDVSCRLESYLPAARAAVSWELPGCCIRTQ